MSRDKNDYFPLSWWAEYVSLVTTQHTACPPGLQRALRSRHKASSAELVRKWAAMFKFYPAWLVSAHSWFACYRCYFSWSSLGNYFGTLDTLTLHLTLLASTSDFGLRFGLPLDYEPCLPLTFAWLCPGLCFGPTLECTLTKLTFPLPLTLNEL